MKEKLIEIAFKLYKVFLKRHAFQNDCSIKNQDLNKQLNKQFPKAEYIIITDAKPKLIYMEDIKKAPFVRYISFRKWVREIFDCENFASVYLGIMAWFYGGHAFGECAVVRPGGRHMLNCFINEFGQFMFLEPQNNKVFSPKDRPDYKVYYIRI